MCVYSPDTSKIVVNVGLGFHVDYTLDEALKFIDAKEIHLNSYVPQYIKSLTIRSLLIINSQTCCSTVKQSERHPLQDTAGTRRAHLFVTSLLTNIHLRRCTRTCDN